MQSRDAAQGYSGAEISGGPTLQGQFAGSLRRGTLMHNRRPKLTTAWPLQQ